MKICNKCGIEKSASDFHHAQANSDGLRSECKTCRRIREAGLRKPPTEKPERVQATKGVCQQTCVACSCGVPKDYLAQSRREAKEAGRKWIYCPTCADSLNTYREFMGIFERRMCE